MTPQTNIQPNALPASFPNAEDTTTTATISELQRLFWLIRRELWENRAIYRAPLIVAALIVLGFSYATARTPAEILVSATYSIDHHQRGIDPIQPYNLAAALILGTTFLVGVFYSLDALYAERRDRSILFWKSLPISDLTTVLSKAAIPLILLPALTFVITVAMQSLMLLINLSVFRLRGLDTAALHANLPLAQGALMLLLHLIGIQILWYAPLWAWLLLVSAWARRTPLLWAVLPPFALGVLEVITLHTTYVFKLMVYRFHGPSDLDFTAENLALGSPMSFSPAHFLATPGLWEGLALAGLFLAAAIQLRRYRNPL